MSPSSRSTTRPSLVRLAELLHQGCRHEAGSVLATIRDGDDGEPVAIGCWPIPAEVSHPADPLIGFLAPPSWYAIGLCTRGVLHETDPEPGTSAGPIAPQPLTVRATVVRSRQGGAATVLETEGGELRMIQEVPEGWVADALGRALGLATPPPTETVAHAVEAIWIDRLATRVLTRPGRCRSWAELARLHPLAPPGAALAGQLLAARSEALVRRTDWRRSRLWLAGKMTAACPVRPPGGQPVDPGRWFDDGSFSRWAQRNLPPAVPLLDAVLQALPSALAAELCAALISVAPSPCPPGGAEVPAATDPTGIPAAEP